MSLQLKWQYLQRTVPGVGALVDLIESALGKNFSQDLFVGEEVYENLQQMLIHRVNWVGVGIPDPKKLVEQDHATSEEVCKALVESLLGGANLNCIGHWSFVRKAIARARKTRERG